MAKITPISRDEAWRQTLPQRMLAQPEVQYYLTLCFFEQFGAILSSKSRTMQIIKEMSEASEGFRSIIYAMTHPRYEFPEYMPYPSQPTIEHAPSPQRKDTL